MSAGKMGRKKIAGSGNLSGSWYTIPPTTHNREHPSGVSLNKRPSDIAYRKERGLGNRREIQPSRFV